MPIIGYDRFSGTLADWTLVQTGGAFTIVSGVMVVTQSDNSSGAFYRIKATRTVGIARAVGQVIYGQFKVNNTALGTAPFLMILAPSVSGDFTGTMGARISNGVSGVNSVLYMYDDSGGVATTDFILTNETWYDFKYTISATLKAILAARVSTAPGDIAASTGAWTTIATSALSVPATIHPQVHFRTADPNMILSVDDYYYTDGTFEPQAPTLLAATAVSPSVIDLTFTDNGNAISETGIKIERATSSGGTFVEIGTVAQGVGSYSDSVGLVESTPYYYRARSYITLSGTDYNSAYTSEATAETSAPSGDLGGDLLVLGEFD